MAFTIWVHLFTFGLDALGEEGFTAQWTAAEHNKGHSGWGLWDVGCRLLVGGGWGGEFCCCGGCSDDDDFVIDLKMLLVVGALKRLWDYAIGGLEFGNGLDGGGGVDDLGNCEGLLWR